MEKIQKIDIVSKDVIRNLKERLNKMIAEFGSDNLLHPEIIELSQLLDQYIAAYTSSLANGSSNL
ncbi:MAG: aspartyl-phosphate phosphatase Spo0E family protein [Caldicoprobacterales bacterium]|jgi:hypothetical protein|nr:aspartyl-phosphate phosphatase Spo0E family protein [Clostridiales bacterium]